MDSKNSLKKFEKKQVALLIVVLIELFLIYLNIYLNQRFPIEQFLVINIQLLAVVFSYVLGLFFTSAFSIIYIVALVTYIVNTGLSLTVLSSLLLLLTPFILLLAANIKKSRHQLKSDLESFEKLNVMQSRIDPFTMLENEFAFSEILKKHTNLSDRYDQYFYSVSMIRIEFLSTLRDLLDVQVFNQMIEDIASIIQTTIRTEDYKFILDNNRFAIITPLTSKEDVESAIRRILEKIEQLTIVDRHGKNIQLVIKYGTIECTHENIALFQETEKIILELQKLTEVDVHGEYIN